MDITSLIRGMLPEAVENTTATEGNTSTAHGMPANIIESILPLVGLKGFAPMYRFIGSWLGWDPTVLLTVLGFIVSKYKSHTLLALVTSRDKCSFFSQNCIPAASRGSKILKRPTQNRDN